MDSATTRKLIDEHFSLAWCRENVVMPTDVIDGAPFGRPGQPTLVIAVGNITFLGTIGGFIKQRVGRTGLECQFIEKPPEEIQTLLDQAAAQRLISGDVLDPAEYDEEALTEALKEAGDGDPAGINFEFDDEDEPSVSEEEILNISNELLGSPLQRAAAQILVKAVKDDVSDIHIEPQENEYRVRLRQDGVLRPFIRIPSRSGIKLTAVLKTMAGMNVAERRASQDGRILRKLEGNKMEFRVSTLPSKYGEKTVLRVLKNDPGMLSLDRLLSNNIEVLNRLRTLIHQSYGIIIVAGPTGSGKSTTLYSAISELNTGENNIVTAEDPIEYTLPGITQVQVLREKNQTFSTILRTFLRQDPDVMLIGETRDPETAKASMEAAQTGHLVLTTLHANNSASSITRLLDMEVPHYLITSSLLGVLAQRLVRRLCTECSVSRPVTEAEAALTRLPIGTPIRAPSALSAEEKEKAKREQRLCNRCQGTGYKGRVGVYELMSVSNTIKTAIRDQRSSQEIQEAACQEGMVTLEDYARALVRDGITSVAELQRLCSSAFD